MNPQPKKITWKSEKYLQFVRRQPCIICYELPSEAHHVRFSNNSGIGMKPADIWAIPLCHTHYASIHAVGQKTFCAWYDIDIYRELFLTAKKFIEKKI